MPQDTEKRLYREETRGKLCHADIFSLLTIENYINSLFYKILTMRGKNYTYYRSIHVFFMRELYFEEFISFAALFFIYEHLKLPASAFHDFNKE